MKQRRYEQYQRDNEESGEVKHDTTDKISGNNYRPTTSTEYVIIDQLTSNNDPGPTMWCTNNRRILKIIYIVTAFLALLVFVSFQIFAPSRSIERYTSTKSMISSTTKISLSPLFNNNNNNNNNDTRTYDSSPMATMEQIQRFIKNLRDPNDIRLLSKHINEQKLTEAEQRRLVELNEEFKSYNLNEKTDETENTNDEKNGDNVRNDESDHRGDVLYRRK